MFSKKTIHFIIYHSHSYYPVNEEITQEIASTAHPNNIDKGFTGMLLATENSFIQYIEGEGLEELESLFEKIKNDTRHEISFFYKGVSDFRVFSKWSMGAWYMQPDELDGLEGFNSLKLCLNNNLHEETSAQTFLELMESILSIWSLKNKK